MKRWYYTPEQIASIVGWDAHYIRIVAKADPDKLPFPTMIRFSVQRAEKKLNSKKWRTQIPRAPFREWYIAQGGDPKILDALDCKLDLIEQKVAAQ